MMVFFGPLLGAVVAVSPSASGLPSCHPNGAWAGPCEWPSQPPPDCPFEASKVLSGLTFSGKVGSYPRNMADTWYPYPGSDGRLYSPFADGSVCEDTKPSNYSAPGFVALVWYWSNLAQDNVLTTMAHPPAQPGYERVGVVAYAVATTSNGDVGELKLWYSASDSDHYTTSSPDGERDATAKNFTLVASLGARLPQIAPGGPVPNVGQTVTLNIPANVSHNRWSSVQLFYDSARKDHWSTPDTFPGSGAYTLVRHQGQCVLGSKLANICVGAGSQTAQGWAILSGPDPFNLVIDSMGSLTRPPFNVTLSVPPTYNLYPSTSFVYRGTWWIDYYFIWGNAAQSRLGPLLGFEHSTNNGRNWSVAGIPVWSSPERPLHGVFEPINLTLPLKVGAPRFADLGPDLVHSPDGRAYVISHGCEDNDGLHCTFMVGDAAYLLRTRRPFSEIAHEPACLNRADTWEFYANASTQAPGAQWVPTVTQATPLFRWPTGVGGVTLTFNPGLNRFLAVVNMPHDRLHSTVCDFDTYVPPVHERARHTACTFRSGLPHCHEFDVVHNSVRRGKLPFPSVAKHYSSSTRADSCCT